MANFDNYDSGNFFDEYFLARNQPREYVKELLDTFNSLSTYEIKEIQKAAEMAFFNMGITFTVTGDDSGVERIFPFDILPRIIDGQEWTSIEKGLKQRVQALNLFINDIYHEQKIIRDGIIPREIIESGAGFLKQCVGLNPRNGIWNHITGTDLVRDKNGQMLVLEDNLRCPSGVSYVIENRLIMKRIFPKAFETMDINQVDDYPSKLLETLEFSSAPEIEDPTVVLLTPGIYNSAYFEHSFLAQQMGIQVVEGQDLVVDNGYIHMKTTSGLQRVDVIYRRIDDLFLDPLCFRKDSMLGVPGLMEVYQKGRVSLVNAPGTGIADDKVVYKFVPDMIKYYLGEDCILPNVPTFLCCNEKEKDHVLKNLENLVVKSANEAGGYGMLIGPASTAQERKEFAEKIKANPRNYLAQPVVSLSRVPTLIDENFEGRHVDLRPYILQGKDIYVMPGGLTRVALKKGSLVVNSSQGGGSKDTWVKRGALC